MTVLTDSLNKPAVQIGRSRPWVTVILTVWKRTCYLEQAISSVLGQTFESLEVLVTDDANQPETRAICAQFNDHRVRYRANTINLGAPLNVAAALREARGTYIALLNDDDFLHPRMVERLLEPFERVSGLVGAICTHKVVDSTGRDLPRETEHALRSHGHLRLERGLIEEPLEFAIRGGAMAAFGCIFRKSACNPDWLIAEVMDAYDYWLAVNLASRGPFYFVPETLMSWRKHENSESVRVFREKYAATEFIYRRLLAFPLSSGLRAYVAHQLAHCLYVRGREFLVQGWGAAEARKVFGQSLRIEWHTKGLAGWALTFFPTKLTRTVIGLWRRTPRELRSSADLGHRPAPPMKPTAPANPRV